MIRCRVITPAGHDAVAIGLRIGIPSFEPSSRELPSLERSVYDSKFMRTV